MTGGARNYLVHYVVREIRMDELSGPHETQDFDTVSAQVRRNLSWRLDQLLASVDEVFRDDPASMTAGMVAAYTGAVRTYAQLWKAMDRPRDDSGMLPAAVVERMLESARIEAAQHALEAERERVRAESAKVLESSQSRVRSRISELVAKRELVARVDEVPGEPGDPGAS